MAINLDATFFAAQEAARIMSAAFDDSAAFDESAAFNESTAMGAARGGSIINFSSINALLGPSNMPG